MRREGYIKGRCSSSVAIRDREQELQDLGLQHVQLVQVQVSKSWPRVKVTNKPTNESKDSGRCRRTACRGCHCCPPTKSLAKTKGRRNKLSKFGLTMLADPAWTLPCRATASSAQKQCLTGNPHLLIDLDCYSDYDSSDDYNAQGHDLGHHINGHCMNDDDRASVFVIHDDLAHHANDNILGGDHHVYDVHSHIHQKQPQGLGICSQFLQNSSVSHLDDDDDDDVSIEWYQVVESDIESNEDEWYFC